MPESGVLHPEMRVLIEAKAALPPATTIEEMRAGWAAYAAANRHPYPDGMKVEDRAIPRAGGSVPVRVYWPAGAEEPSPCVIYIHGGGFMKGDLESSDTVAWGLADQTGAVVVSVDYRLAPENPYPAAFDDCYAVLTEIAANGGAYRVDPGRVAVCGDSAGGNLSAAVSLAARDRGGPRIAAQALIYPCLTDERESPSYRSHADTPGLTSDAMGDYWEWYLAGSERPCQDPYAVPLKASDLANLPPAYIHIAEVDPLADDGRSYADRLGEAGVPAEFHCAEAMIHGFLRARFAGPDCAAIFGRLCAYLKRQLA